MSHYSNLHLLLDNANRHCISCKISSITIITQRIDCDFFFITHTQLLISKALSTSDILSAEQELSELDNRRVVGLFSYTLEVEKRHVSNLSHKGMQC